MSIINFNLIPNKKVYENLKKGLSDTEKNLKKEKRKFEKNVQALSKSAKNVAYEVKDTVNENKTAFIIAGGVAVTGTVVIGTAVYFATRKKRKAKRQFKKSFNQYINALQSDSLTIDDVDLLIENIDRLNEFDKNGKVGLCFSESYIKQMLFEIYGFTKGLARANNIDLRTVKSPKCFSRGSIFVLQRYLNIQRNILIDKM